MRKNGFDIRILIIFVLLTVLMFGCVLRLYKISTDSQLAAKQYNNTYRIKLGNVRGSIFDRNLNAITNSNYKIIAVVSPTPLGIAAISAYLQDDERLYSVVQTLRSGKPATVEVDREIDSEAVKCVKVYKNSVADYHSAQLIGYTNDQNHGVSGIEQAYDETLYNSQNLEAVFAIDSFGNLLNGVRAEIIGDTALYRSGIALTIDNQIQKIAYNAMKNVSSGAAVVMEVGSGKIRAMVSNPDFDMENIEEFLQTDNSPFVNRSLLAYNVGSVFKPCVAAAIIENNTHFNTKIYCNGKTDIEGHKFSCHNVLGHGLTDLQNAITHSCNVFFYNISVRMGANSIYDMASVFSFGKSLDIGGLKTAAGSVPSRETVIEKSTALANLSIGQGELLLSPVSILTLYEAIANEGVYNTPTVIEGEVDKGILKTHKSSAPTKAISKQTAQILKQYLVNVIENGTGKAAKPELCSAAGKTATAQTGWEKKGRLIQNSWFCGFFPVENPKYVAVVMIEDEVANGTSGAPIFKSIADGIMQLAIN